MKRILVVFFFCLVTNSSFSTTWIDPYFKDALIESNLVALGKILKKNENGYTVELTNVLKGDKNKKVIFYNQHVQHSKYHNHENENELKEGSQWLFILFKSNHEYVKKTESFGVFYIDDSIAYLPIKDPLSKVVVPINLALDYIKKVLDPNSIDLQKYKPEAKAFLESSNVNSKIESDIYNQITYLEVLALIGDSTNNKEVIKYFNSPYYHVKWSVLNALNKCAKDGDVDYFFNLILAQDSRHIQSLIGKFIFQTKEKIDDERIEKIIPLLSDEEVHLASEIMNPIFNTLPSPRYSITTCLMKSKGQIGTYNELLKKSTLFIDTYKNIRIDPLEKAQNFYSINEGLQNPEKVLSLILSHDSLKSIPEDIKKFKNLLRLDLGGDELKDLPDWLSTLQKITHLDISKNKFEKLPIAIEKLSNLEFLDLGDNPLVLNEGSLANNSKLKSLILSDIKIKSIPSSVCRLKNLTFLSLSGTRLDTINEEIKHLENLERLSLRMTKINSIPDAFRNLSKLVYIDLYGNDFIEFPAELIFSNSLKEIHLGSCNINNLKADISRMKSLKFIDLSYNELDVTERERISTSYEGIIINTQGYNDRFFSIKDALMNPDNAKSVYANNSNLKDSVFDLSTLNKIRYLGLVRNGFTEFPQWLFTNANIKFLRLDHNPISSLPSNINLFKDMYGFSAMNSNLESLPQEFFSLYELKEVYLNGCHFTKFPFELLEKLPKIQTIGFAGNPISEEEKEKVNKMAKSMNITVYLD